MRSVGKIKRLFWFSIIFLFLMSGSVLIMPMAMKVGERDRSILLLSGLGFWISCITGYILLLMANEERKYFISCRLDGDLSMGCKIGIITFFDNVPATIADVAMISSFLLFVEINFTKYKYDYISYVLLFILIFSLNMHCLFNGRIYKATKYKRTRRGKSYE